MWNQAQLNFELAYYSQRICKGILTNNVNHYVPLLIFKKAIRFFEAFDLKRKHLGFLKLLICPILKWKSSPGI